MPRKNEEAFTFYIHFRFMSKHKLIIIGGGPAGLSAALYAARAGLKPLLFAGSPPGGQLMLTSEVENFPGRESILGPELVETLRKQALFFGTQIIDENVQPLKKTNAPFTVVESAGKEYQTESVIVATGAKALWLGLESETRLKGRGVSACATCDGFFFKNKIVAVVGGGDTAMEEAQTLTRFAKMVYLIHRRDSFKASRIMQERVTTNPKITLILQNEIVEIMGEAKVTGVRLKNPFKGHKEIALDGVFVAIGHKPDTNIVSFLQCDPKGYIYTAQTFASFIASSGKNFSKTNQFDYVYPSSTSIPGIFAAGDCVDHLYKQAGTAAGMGVAAALDVERWLANRSL